MRKLRFREITELAQTHVDNLRRDLDHHQPGPLMPPRHPASQDLVTNLVNSLMSGRICDSLLEKERFQDL